jgi:hypothetical protein
LSDYFDGVAVKRLSTVETTPSQSNQHDFNGSRPLRKLLNDDDRRGIKARFPTARLTMLGVKSTLKDRCRQVLAEANRISKKHLLTLEAGVSVNQTEQIKAASLQLVILKAIHASFAPGQQAHLLSVEGFLRLVQARQAER